MTHRDNIEDSIKQYCDEKTSGLETDVQLDKRTIQDARAAQSESIREGDRRKKVHKRIAELAAAAVLVIGVLLGLHFFSGPIEITTPAFADVMKNMLSQKWVYMFGEDRKSGQINWECWYNPSQQKAYTRNHLNDNSVNIQEITNSQIREYKDNTVTISDTEDYRDVMDWLEQCVPLGDWLSRYEQEGADIVQREATYNSKPALLYEIELSLPGRSFFPPGIQTDLPGVLETEKYSWLVDKKTHLPIICISLRIHEMLREGKYQSGVISSRRYAFDYCDSGPADIYDLGVPHDANVVDTRPDPEIQKLIDRIEQIKRTKYNSFAVVMVERGLPSRVIIRDGLRIRNEHIELKVNYSDFEQQKEKYLQQMGDSFDSIYRWMGETDIFRKNSIAISNGRFRYETGSGAIDANTPVNISRWRGANEDFTFNYCWRTPCGQVVKTAYAAQHGLICTHSGERYYYYDPVKDYMCVRIEGEDGRLHHEIAKFGRTSGGMLYPTLIQRGNYTEKDGFLKLVGLLQT